MIARTRFVVMGVGFASTLIVPPATGAPRAGVLSAAPKQVSP
jgi:hypothetical protein